jgi:DNA-binding PadR family transcriptional regulator
MTITDTPLFDLAVGIEAPRARKADRVQSHLAADRSQRTMHATKRAVLTLVLQEGELPGKEINDLYHNRRDRHDWGTVAPDTPRKRAGELAEDGYLSARYETSEGNHLPEAFYSITDKGREALA